MSTKDLTVEHADVIALSRVTKILTDQLGDHDAQVLLNDLFNAGVVFRMAKWWMDENTRGLTAHVLPREPAVITPIESQNWDAASQQAPMEEWSEE